MVEVTITVGKARGLATFGFATTAGRPPQVNSVVVMDRNSGLHCWLIEPGVLGGAVNTQAQLQERLHTAGLRITAGVDPIEDLSPLDPRYRMAEHYLMDVVEAANPELRHLTYGVLPAGFQQILPEAGGAVPLETGRRYEISPWGRDEASLEFVAP
jgi:hypothetical protein